MSSQTINERVRPALAGFEPYDPAFSPCDINLSANENTHPLPAAVASSIGQILAGIPLNRYPDPLANELRDELALWHGVARENIMVGNGGDEILFNLLFAFGGPGRALVVAPPCFEEYKNFAKMCETDVVEVWRSPVDYSLDEDGFVAAAKNAAMVMITSPNNPTGNLVDPSFVRRLLDSTDALVLLDEAYVEFAGKDSSLIPWAASNPRLMVLRTLSKAFGMAGLRCGYLVADQEVVDVLAAIRQIYSEDVLAQAVATEAVRRRSEFEPVVSSIVREREYLCNGLAQLPNVKQWPSQANFVLVRLPHAAQVRARLRDEYSILVRDFSYSKGLEDCLRITVGTREENERLLQAIGCLTKGE